MGLFTYDIDLDCIEEPVLPESPLEFASVSYSKTEYSNEWEQHPDLATTWAVDDDFLDKFSEGFDHYRHGEWQEAKEFLTECRWARRNSKNEAVEDGPSVTLLEYMEQFDFCAPEDWPGYRELVEK